MTESQKNDIRRQIKQLEFLLGDDAKKSLIMVMFEHERDEAISFIKKCIEELSKLDSSIELSIDLLNVALCRLGCDGSY